MCGNFLCFGGWREEGFVVVERRCLLFRGTSRRNNLKTEKKKKKKAQEICSSSSHLDKLLKLSKYVGGWNEASHSALMLMTGRVA